MGPKRAKQKRHHSRHAQRVLPGQRRKEKYPLATIAYYGPDDKVPTKIAVGIFEAEGADPIVERWRGPDVATNLQVAAEINAYLKAHNVQQVAMTDGIIGCAHEEGIDLSGRTGVPLLSFLERQAGHPRAVILGERTQLSGAMVETWSISKRRVRMHDGTGMLILGNPPNKD